jgi:hypothetical protein
MKLIDQIKTRHAEAFLKAEREIREDEKLTNFEYNARIVAAAVIAGIAIPDFEDEAGELIPTETNRIANEISDLLKKAFDVSPS